MRKINLCKVIEKDNGSLDIKGLVRYENDWEYIKDRFEYGDDIERMTIEMLERYDLPEEDGDVFHQMTIFLLDYKDSLDQKGW